MHKKSIRLFIATLSLSLTTLLGGCGASATNIESKKDTVQNSVTESPRFYSERVIIDGDARSHFNYSYIVTDNETGQQWLYVYHSGGRAGGSAMVELDITEVSDNMEE